MCFFSKYSRHWALKMGDASWVLRHRASLPHFYWPIVCACLYDGLVRQATSHYLNQCWLIINHILWHWNGMDHHCAETTVRYESRKCMLNYILEIEIHKIINLKTLYAVLCGGDTGLEQRPARWLSIHRVWVMRHILSPKIPTRFGLSRVISNLVMYRPTLHGRHCERDGVSNHQPHDCLIKRLFRHRWKKTSELRVTGLCEGNSPVTGEFPHKGPVTRNMFPFDDVIMFLLSPRITSLALGIIIPLPQCQRSNPEEYGYIKQRNAHRADII